MKLRIGSRKSPLAKAQAQTAIAELQARRPDVEVEWVWIVTTGDRIRDRPLNEVGGKGLFLKEIEQALVDGVIDVAVHSGKDVPAGLVPGLEIVATPRRANPYDVLCTRDEISDLAAFAGRVGTGSLRRRHQAAGVLPRATILPLRGNVGTRLGKVEAGELEGVILAAAGLERLGLDWRGHRRELREFVPAVAQGTLAIEARAGDVAVRDAFSEIHDTRTWREFLAERAALAALDGDCFTPFGAFAETMPDGALRLRAALWREDGADCRRAETVGDDPVALGEAVGAQLLRRDGLS